MQNLGIIVEYNPFHNGHRYQLDYAKNVLKAECITVAMSGSFTQRGEISITDKYTRANMALVSGADLVLEIPAVFATSSAREFATCGIHLLVNAGVTDLLCGTENASEDDIMSIAKVLCDRTNIEVMNAAINSHVKMGLSYAASRSLAVENMLTPEQNKMLTTPNNILAIEYACAILLEDFDIALHTLNRSDNGYHSNEAYGEFASASFIRNALLKNEAVDKYISPQSLTIFRESGYNFSPDDISLLLHEKLISSDDFTDILDCSKDLSNKIIKTRNQFLSFSQYCDLLKSKDLSHTRISRVLCHILLGITTELSDNLKDRDYVTYLRILGATHDGLSLLSDIKKNCPLPILTAPDLEALSDSASKASLSLDSKSYDTMRLISVSKYAKPLPLEKTRKFLKV